ncbi:hypothetical protein [Mesorhizobium sp. M0203]|uniref:hypothetical protein n=1 Tax=Mesorhizobium sp. M0203 TaxID=2956912 RepID=UPI00333E0648
MLSVAQTLRKSRVASIERFAKLLAFDVSTMELAGESVRCMLAGIHYCSRANERPRR